MEGVAADGAGASADHHQQPRVNQDAGSKQEDYRFPT
jgi:hypothetical protein